MQKFVLSRRLKRLSNVNTERDVCQEGKKEKEEAEGAADIEPRNGFGDFDGDFHWVRDAVMLDHFHDLVTVEVFEYRVGHPDRVAALQQVVRDIDAISAEDGVVDVLRVVLWQWDVARSVAATEQHQDEW